MNLFIIYIFVIDQASSVPPVAPVTLPSTSTPSKNKKPTMVIIGLIMLGLLVGLVVALYRNEILKIVNPNSVDDTVPSETTTTSLPTPTTIITDRQQILNAFAKLKDSTSLKYSVIGSDGDELSFVREYTIDLEEVKEYSSHDEDSIISTEAYKYSEYLIDGKFYLQTEDGEVIQTEERRAPYSLDDIGLSLNFYLNAEGYTMTSTRTEKEYKGQSAYYIKLDYKKIFENTSFWNKFKAYADLVPEAYSVEAYTTLDGELLELVIPKVYSQVTYRFLETNQEYDISLPLTKM